MKKQKLGSRIWLSILMFGLFGQIAWVVENMYFNLFLYRTISGDTQAIATMVAASAITATLTTMVMGALSDKVGKRKIFICAGYVLWGLTTLSFGFISLENIQAVFPTVNAALVGIVLVIVMDCVMTFFGSTANDGAFNAWVTDITDENNRAKVESVLAILPLLALLIIFGGFDGMTVEGSSNWPLFFYILGGLVTLGGVIGFFLIGDSQVEKPEGHYWKTLIYGFRPSTVKSNPLLYLTLVAFGIFGIASQVYMPYFIIYIQKYMLIDAYAILLGVVILGASIVSVIVSSFIKADNRNKFFYPSLGIMLAGLLMLFFFDEPGTALLVGIAGFVMMSGNLILTAILGARIRDLTPKDKVGHFQGIRMIFYVLIPMIVGPYIGSAVIKNSGLTYVDEIYGIKDVPTPGIFLAAGIALLFVLVPLVFALKKPNPAETGQK